MPVTEPVKKKKKKTSVPRAKSVTSVAELEAVLASGVVALLTTRSPKVAAACATTGARVVLIPTDVAMRVGFGFALLACFFADGVFVSFCSAENSTAIAKELRRAAKLVGRARAESEAWCAEPAPTLDDAFAAALAGDYVCNTFRLVLDRDGGARKEWRREAGDREPAETSKGAWRRTGRDIVIELREEQYGVDVVKSRYTLLVGFTGGRAVELRHLRPAGVLPRLTADPRVDWRRR